MLPKKKRLKTAEFNRFFMSGTRLHSQHLQLRYTQHPQFHGAVVVGKKVAKGATERNKIRRRLYHLLYHHHRSKGLTGVFIVLTKPTTTDVPYSVLGEELKDLLHKIKS